jgi:peptidoglycan/xylan/chitin deacetylase (PgdA/CDA1 family)
MIPNEPKEVIHQTDYRATLPVLLYHDIGPHSSNPRFQDFVVEPRLFAEHLAAIRNAGFVTEPVSQLRHIERSNFPEAPIFITFDDAYLSFIEYAQPALLERNMTASLFVPTACIGGRAEWLDVIGEGDRRILGWHHLRQLRASGIEIGSHGHEHLQLDLLSQDQLVSETQWSRAILEDGLGESVRTFAYPFGFHNRRVREEVCRSGYEVAFEVGDDLYSPSRDEHYSITRIQVGSDMDPDQLIAVIRQGRSSSLARCIHMRLNPARKFAGRRWRRWLARNASN